MRQRLSAVSVCQQRSEQALTHPKHPQWAWCLHCQRCWMQSCSAQSHQVDKHLLVRLGCPWVHLLVGWGQSWTVGRPECSGKDPVHCRSSQYADYIGKHMLQALRAALRSWDTVHGVASVHARRLHNTSGCCTCPAGIDHISGKRFSAREKYPSEHTSESVTGGHVPWPLICTTWQDTCRQRTHVIHPQHREVELEVAMHAVLLQWCLSCNAVSYRKCHHRSTFAPQLQETVRT